MTTVCIRSGVSRIWRTTRGRGEFHEKKKTNRSTNFRCGDLRWSLSFCWPTFCERHNFMEEPHSKIQLNNVIDPPNIYSNWWIRGMKEYQQLLWFRPKMLLELVLVLLEATIFFRHNENIDQYGDYFSCIITCFSNWIECLLMIPIFRNAKFMKNELRWVNIIYSHFISLFQSTYHFSCGRSIRWRLLNRSV